jgi:hypothetical protein
MENGYLRILHNNNIITFEAFSINSNEHKKIVTTNIDGIKNRIRRDGVLVREVVGKNIFGLSEKHADIFISFDNSIHRIVYTNYQFKDPFGGYWLGRKHIFTFNRCSDSECEEIMNKKSK